jgi:alpha-galactosidase
MASANPRRFPMLPPANPRPAIHGARVVGASPRRPFLFLIPATGKAPLSHAANNLPDGLVLNAKSGIISGRIKQAGTYKVELVVKNALGRANRVLNIVCGDNKLAQTPPMGWNAWNVFGETVSADKIREQADWLIKSGLAAHGYNTIIIDDTWQARRDSIGNIAPNRRFGDIKALADYVHSKGLKLGIFSSPNAETCSGFAGSEGYEAQDAATYASWGIDYLKYDWCAAGRRDATSTAVVRAAYAKMRTALDKTDRDIVYALTTYGFGNPWEWAAADDVRGNSWTTNSSILDKWEFIRDNGFNQPQLASKAGPGHWNDPGWLMLGKIGSGNPHFSRLKANEQVLQVSLWSLLAAPMIVSCDLRQLNPNALYPITTALLTNDEVIDINQDPLGKAATRVLQNGDIEIWARPLWDGTQAVGIFNKGGWQQDVRVEWSQLGMSGSQPARDVWQHSDLGVSPGVSLNVPRHGAVLLKVGKPDESSTR